MLSVKINFCNKCGIMEGEIGMLEGRRFISDIDYYFGCGSLEAKPVQVKLNEDGICNICTTGTKG